MPTGFKRLFDLLYQCISSLPKPIVIQAGSLAEHPFFSLADVVVDFASSTQMKHWASEAKIIISHAGVGNVKMANDLGKRPILLPRLASLGEHIDDHQLELAEILESGGLASTLHAESTPDQIRKVIQATASGELHTKGHLDIKIPHISLTGQILAVSSVGGHRAELEKIIRLHDDAKVLRLTDEICEEVKSGSISRFPSCNKRRHIPIRLVQALWFLLQHKDITAIITTGAGVGAIFVLAGKLLGKRTISIESMTRIKAPGLWFKLAGKISDEAYGYNWAQWLHEFPNIKVLEVNISRINQGDQLDQRI
jgi:UDP-N-acetylglucosamine transferase subunit ALG13